MLGKKKETGIDKAKRVLGLACLAIAATAVVVAYVMGFVRERLGADHKPLPEKGSIVSVKGQTQLKLVGANKKSGSPTASDASNTSKE